MATTAERRERLTSSIQNRRREKATRPEITDEQIGLVLRSLADHTQIMDALNFSLDDSSPWPQATSIGRWFHALADEFEGLNS